MALRFVIIIALIIAALGLGFVAYRAITPSTIPSRPQAALPKKRDVVVLTQPKAPGSILTETDIRTDSIGIDKLPDNALPAASPHDGSLIGAMVRVPLSTGAVLRVNDVLPKGKRGFLSAALAPGMRAISIAVDAVTGAAGLVAPDDRVDLLLTQGSASDQPTKPMIVSENVMTNLRVVAVDQRFVANVESKDGPGLARTVTVEVTPDQALRVAVAEQLGRLSLAVRPVEPPAASSTGDGPPVYARDVSRGSDINRRVNPRRLPLRQAGGSLVTVIQGTDIQKVALP